MGFPATYPARGPRELVSGYILFITDSTNPPDTQEITGELPTLATMYARHDPLGIVTSVARTAQGLFRITLNGQFGEVYAQAQAHKQTLHRAQVYYTGVIGGVHVIDVAVLDNLGALVDTDEVNIGVQYTILLSANALTRP